MIRKIRPVMGGQSIKDNETLLFAAQEIQKYLTEISDSDFTVIPVEKVGEEADALYLGVGLATLPVVEDKELDDAISIDVNNVAGVITATNARAVLIAAYRYLKELGFAFIRPGKKGEYYPDKLYDKTVKIKEAASSRHRAICIEGCVSQKRLTDMIDWVPKAGMNGYMVQFVIPKPFFKRWYKAGMWWLFDPPYRAKTQISGEDMLAILKLAEGEIGKRSLIYHGVGHGWTCRAFGIEQDGWGEHDEPDEKYRHILAEFNGERKLRNGNPNNTALCLSTDEAREKMIDVVVKYAKEHPNLDYLHVWMQDGTNGNCECENCRKLRTSDWFVKMMNELDERLIKEGIDTKIAFLVYVDLFWSPIRERLINKDRFLIGYAPIFRTYSNALDTDEKGTMLPYEVNKLEFPEKVEDNLEYIKDWQKNFDCDTFVFDYHHMWDHYVDMSQYNLAKILSRDIKAYEKLKLNGLMNCRVSSSFLPSSVATIVMTETLWNKEADFERIADYVLRVEFGKDFGLVKDYLSSLSEYGCAKAFRGEEPVSLPENIINLKKATGIINEFQEVINEHLSNGNKQIDDAWDRLKFFSGLYKLLLELAQLTANGEMPDDVDYICDFAMREEFRLRDEFDALYFVQTFKNRIVKDLKQSGEKFIGDAN